MYVCMVIKDAYLQAAKVLLAAESVQIVVVALWIEVSL